MAIIENMGTPPRVALLIESSRTYGRELLRGIRRYSRTHGPWIFPWVFYKQDLFYISRGSSQEELEHIKNWKPNGIIARDSKDVQEMEKWNVPLFISVAVKAPVTNRNNIITDDAAIAKMAAEHLLERGFKHFAYCGFNDIFWSRQRGESFSARIAEAGFKTHIYKQPKSRATRAWYREEPVLAEWLKELPKPVGVMACNDDRGQHITEACGIANLDVPYEVAVVGVDNDDVECDFSNPPLSSVELNVEKSGYQASELLDKMMAGEKMGPQTVVVSPIRVITRQSTDIVAVEDKIVSQALHFIHQNGKKLIQVEDVIKALNVSKSSLHERFMKELGRSVHDEIKRVRINLVSQMLLDSDLPISEIAQSLGYENTDHFARYFKQRKGVAPLYYRKLHGRE